MNEEVSEISNEHLQDIHNPTSLEEGKPKIKAKYFTNEDIIITILSLGASTIMILLFLLFGLTFPPW